MSTSVSCESCGRSEALTLVVRLYVTIEDWDAEGRIDEGGEEWWCDVCRYHYPHRLPDAND